LSQNEPEKAKQKKVITSRYKVSVINVKEALNDKENQVKKFDLKNGASKSDFPSRTNDQPGTTNIFNINNGQELNLNYNSKDNPNMDKPLNLIINSDRGSSTIILYGKAFNDELNQWLSVGDFRGKKNKFLFKR
jgi:hypothetical protein